MKTVPKALYQAVNPANVSGGAEACDLVGVGLSVNDVNSMGITAAMGAANRGSDEIIQWLVDKGAKLDVKDAEGRTPLNWHSRSGGSMTTTCRSSTMKP